MTDVYNAEIYKSDHDDPSKHFANIWNQALYAMDSWVILKGSPNLDKAYPLLKFLGDPERQKDINKYESVGLTSRKALSLVDKKMLPYLPTAPENFANSLEISAPFWLDNLDKLNDRFTKWASAQ
jgi:putative spermidine/putrescine transport system substrate-binding protein